MGKGASIEKILTNPLLRCREEREGDLDFCVPWGLRVCLPSTCIVVVSSDALEVSIADAMESYGAGGDAVEALLALDGHVGAVGSLELDIKGSCIPMISMSSLVPCSVRRRMLTLGGVVEVLVDKLEAMSAHDSMDRDRINGYTHVVGGLAQVTEGRDGESEGTVDLLGELLGAAEGLGDIGGERRRHVEEAAVCDGRVWMSLVLGINNSRRESRGEE